MLAFFLKKKNTYSSNKTIFSSYVTNSELG